MVTERHNPKRRNLLAESRLLGEYLAERYAGRDTFIRLRIGATGVAEDVDMTDESRVALLRNRNRYADAIVVDGPELVVVEATMYRAEAKVGQLLMYLEVVRETPVLVPYVGLRVVGELVTGQHDPVAQLIAQRAGLRYVFYEPAWIADFFALYPERKRRTGYAGLWTNTPS